MMEKEEMLWCGRRLSELSREELETALWQCYAMFMDVNSPEAIAARAKAQARKTLEDWGISR
jgi:hypothetical protein